MNNICTGYHFQKHPEVVYASDECPVCSAIRYAIEMERLVDGFMNFCINVEDREAFNSLPNLNWIVGHVRAVYPEFNSHPLKRPRPWIGKTD